MSYCIATVIGFILGAACVIIASRVMCPGTERDTSSASQASAPSPQGEGFEGEEQLKKQWENILNYNGTGNGQMPIGDE
ncbi:MAG: hypothetical protein IJF32_05815 [Oscillospiraceae bacterium]|nr:hypothetical protein [Oscillospiraceae bacterium]